MDDLAFAPVSKQRELIVSQQILPMELAELYFRRIEKRDAQLNAYLTLTRGQAMGAAWTAETSVMRGDELGPLYFRVLPFTYPINLIGYPMASIPCGFSSDGLPIGLHLIERRCDAGRGHDGSLPSHACG